MHKSDLHPESALSHFGDNGESGLNKGLEAWYAEYGIIKAIRHFSATKERLQQTHIEVADLDDFNNCIYMIDRLAILSDILACKDCRNQMTYKEYLVYYDHCEECKIRSKTNKRAII